MIKTCTRMYETDNTKYYVLTVEVKYDYGM